MKRVLFVDDEVNILDGLRRMAHEHRAQWHAAFAASGRDGLSMLESAEFDVVVTDMRMPGMDGIELLELVRDRYPAIIRIILSGYFDAQATLRAAPLAHQFLIKPCDASKLQNAVERSTEIAAILSDAQIRRAISAVGELPPMPKTYAALTRALADPESTMADLAQIVQSDVAVSTKVLQLVGPSHSDVTDPSVTVTAAINELGRDALRYLVVSVGLFREFPHTKPIRGFSADEFQHHSQLVAAVAERLPLLHGVAGDAATAAFLHDVGKLVLVSRFPEALETALMESARLDRPLYAVEKKMMGTSHAQVGACLLGLWGLSSGIVAAVSRHHDPDWENCTKNLTLSAAINVADALVHEHLDTGTVHKYYLDQVTVPTVTRHLARWRKMTAEIVHPVAVG